MNLQVREFEIAEECDENSSDDIKKIITSLSTCIDLKFKKNSGFFNDNLFCKPDVENFNDNQLIQTAKDLGMLLLNIIQDEEEENLIEIITECKGRYISKNIINQIIAIIKGNNEENCSLEEYYYLSKYLCQKKKLLRIIQDEHEEEKKINLELKLYKK